MTSTTKPIRILGALLILGVGAIHVQQSSYWLTEGSYVGWLFLAAAAGALVVAIGLLATSDLRVWALGALISACCFVGFILSRTTGLPGGVKEPVWTTIGIVSLIVEVAFVAVALVARSVVAPRARERRPAVRTTSGSYA